MPRIADVVGAQENLETEQAELENPILEEQTESSGGFDIMGILKTETGEGEVHDYLDHPLNFNGSKGMAQIIRGITGFAGNIRLAVVDIFVGMIRIGQERKAMKNVQADPVRE